MKHLKLSLIILLLALLFGVPLNWAAETEFLISTEPDSSQFVHKDPRLFFDNSNGFIISWEDWRDGEYGAYAQRFDKHGNLIGRNFPLFGHYRLTVMPDNSILSISRRVEPEDYVYYTAQIERANGLKSAAFLLERAVMPPCPVGFLGEYLKAMSSDDDFRVLINFDKELIFKRYDVDGNLLSTYSHKKSWPDTTTRVYYSGGCQPNSYSVLTWFQLFDGVYYPEENADTFQATFFDADDSLICDNVVIDSISMSICWGGSNEMAKVVCLDPEHYLFLFFDINRNSLKFVKYNICGKAQNAVNEILLPTGLECPDSLETTYLQDFNLSQINEETGTFEVLISSWFSYQNSPSVERSYRQTFNRLGEPVDSVSVFSGCFRLTSENYWRLNAEDFYVPGFSKARNKIYLSKYTNCVSTSSIQINDDSSGANQRAPLITQLDENRVLVSWHDEESIHNQVLDLDGKAIGEPKRLGSKQFLRLSDSLCLGFSNSILTYYRNDDWSVFKQDTVELNNEKYRGKIEAYLVCDGRFILLLKRNSQVNLQAYDLKGNKLAEAVAFECPYHKPILCPNDSNSFWMASYMKLQLYSKELTPLSSIKEIDRSLCPITAHRPGTLICRKVNYPDDYNMCILDSSGLILAEFPFPQLADINLNLQCILIDTAKFALMWTENKNVYCQLFDSKFDPITETFLIHAAPEAHQADGAACVIDNQLFCVWSDSRNPGHGYDIYGRIFDIDKFTFVPAYKSESFIPSGFSLSQNFPNPFNSSTMIKYRVNSRCKISIAIYNVLGKQIKILKNARHNPGSYLINWDGSDAHGKKVSSGIYFYEMRSGQYGQLRKIMKLLVLR